MNFAMMNAGMYLLRRREEGGGCGSLGCFVFLLILGAVIYFIMKGRRDKPEELGAAKRATMPWGMIQWACSTAGRSRRTALRTANHCAAMKKGT